MKFFAIIFLFGLATASLHDIFDDNDEEDFLLESQHKKGGDDLHTELGRKLRDALDRTLKRIKETVEDGKDVSKKLLDEARHLVNKLKSYGMDVSDEAKAMLEYFRTRVETWVEELLDILHDNSSTVHRADNVPDYHKKTQEDLKRLLEEVKRTIEQGKAFNQELKDKIKELVTQLKEYGVNVSGEVKDMLEYLRTRVSKWADDLLSILRGKRSIEDRLQRLVDIFKLREPLEKLREMVDEGVTSDAITEFINEHLSRSSYVRMHLLDYLEEGHDILKRFLDVLLGEGDARKRSIIDKIRNKIEELNLGETFRKLKELVDSKFDSGRIKDFIREKIPEKASWLRDYLTKTVDKGKEAISKFLEWFKIGKGGF